MANVDRSELYDTIVRVVDAASYDLVYSNEILTPDNFPNSRLSGAFSVDFVASNTDDFRDARSKYVRVEDSITVRVARRINPKNQQQTLKDSFDIEKLLTVALINSREHPLQKCRTTWVSTDRDTVNREYMFTDIQFSIKYSMELV